MKLNLNLTNRTPKQEFSNEARKEITLLYLEETLYKEEYEDCVQLIQNAKKFGATEEEVKAVLGKFLKNKGKRPRREAISTQKNAGFTGLRRF